MTIQKDQDGTTLIVIPDERLDNLAARDMEGELCEQISGATELIFEFSHVKYVTSAALRVLFSAHKIMKEQGSMVIRHANRKVMEIFEITGFSQLLTFEDCYL